MLTSIGTIVAIVLGVGGVVVSLVTQLNHVSHLQADVSEIKETLKELSRKVEKNTEEIGKMQTRCEERHK